MTKVTLPMTPEGLKLRLAELDVTLVTMADAWGYTRQQVSRWMNGRAPIPSWAPYALGLVTLGNAPAEKPMEAPKPAPAPIVTKQPAKPVQPPKPKAPDPMAKGVWRFNRFYPD